MAKCAVCGKAAHFGNNVSHVSYTHLDVYKRQLCAPADQPFF